MCGRFALVVDASVLAIQQDYAGDPRKFFHGSARPHRMKIRPASFINLQALPKMCEGSLIADVVAVIGTLDIVLGEIDRAQHDFWRYADPRFPEHAAADDAFRQAIARQVSSTSSESIFRSPPRIQMMPRSL